MRDITRAVDDVLVFERRTRLGVLKEHERFRVRVWRETDIDPTHL